jgi:NAD-dependent deacetylase
MKRLVVLTGAGVSAESGLQTFRGSEGLWEGHAIEDVATPDAWNRNPQFVQDFYNYRRRQILEAAPNAAHLALVQLEAKYEVIIITQNIDDLHERAGSSNVLHLHGIITRSQSTKDPLLTYPIKGWKLDMNSTCELGSPLRPYIVWFGETVPLIEEAIDICKSADVFILIGTSLVVYPAAGLLNYVPSNVIKHIIDPNILPVSDHSHIIWHQENAGTGVGKVVQLLLKD